MRLLLCALLITSNAIACDYESDDLIQYEGQSNVGVDRQKSLSLCRGYQNMHHAYRITNKGEWYSSKEKYIFGSNVSEDKLVLLQRVVQSQ